MLWFKIVLTIWLGLQTLGVAAVLGSDTKDSKLTKLVGLSISLFLVIGIWVWL